MRLLLIISNLILVLANNSDISVLRPTALHDYYQINKLDFTIANFGTVPYGNSIYGSVYKSAPVNACKPLKKRKNDNDSSNDMIIMYAVSGGCHYAEKALIAQEAAAKLLVIGDTDEEEVNDKIIYESSHKLIAKLKIPTIIISKADAKRFQSVLDDETSSEGLEMTFNFNLIKVKDQAVVKFILQVDDGQSYDALIKFQQYRNKLHNDLKTQVHYKVLKNANLKFNDDDCIKDKHTYCVIPQDKRDKPMGIIQETLKQLCLFNDNFNTYMQYINKVKAKCFELDNTARFDFKECTDESYIDSVDENTRERLKSCTNIHEPKAINLLEGNNDGVKYYMLNYSLIIFINDNIYKGNYNDPSNLAKTICNSFEELPESCKQMRFYKFYEDLKTEKITVFLTFVIFCLVIMICLILALFYMFYKRRLMKSFETQLEARVKHALMEYNKKKNHEQTN